MSIKVTIDAVVHTNGSMLELLTIIGDVLTELQNTAGLAVNEGLRECLASSTWEQVRRAQVLVEAVTTQIDLLSEHADSDANESLVPNSLAITGTPDDDLPPGGILLDVGPFAIELEVGSLRRALLPFDSA